MQATTIVAVAILGLGAGSLVLAGEDAPVAV